MANLKTKVTLYLEANSKTWDAEKNNIILQNDGAGDYINTWNVSGVTEPTAEELASYENAGNSVEALNTILAKRSSEYPLVKDQLDMQYHDKVDGTTTWQDAIQAVKDANPKP